MTGIPRLVSSLTARLLFSVLIPTPVTARSRSGRFVISSSRSTVNSQCAPVAPGLARTSRIAGDFRLDSWLARYCAR